MAAIIHPLLFQGTLLDQNGDALEDAKIQLWQTDLDGNYLHPNPGAAGSPKSPDHASIISDFQYFGTDSTDSNGNFDFLTYRPGIYPNRPYAHFHFMVWLEGEPMVGDDTGEYTTLPNLVVTQFYFKDNVHPSFPEVLQLDDVTEVDANIYKYGGYVNGTIVVDAGTGGTLLQASPTQPEGPFYPIPRFFLMDNDLTTADADDATTKTTVNPTVSKSPTVGPTAPAPSNNNDTAAITTGPTQAPALAVSASTKSPTGPAAPIPSNNNATLPTSTVVPTSAAEAWGCNFHGLVGLWLLASSTFLRKYIF